MTVKYSDAAIAEAPVKVTVTAKTPKGKKAIQAFQAKADTMPDELKVVVAPTKVKAKTQAVVLAEELIHIYNRLTEAEAFVAIKRYDELKKELQSIAAESGAPQDQPYTFTTEEGDVCFSKCRDETVITDKNKLIKTMTLEVFCQVAKVSLADVRKYLSESEVADISKKEYGARSLTAVVPK